MKEDGEKLNSENDSSCTTYFYGTGAKFTCKKDLFLIVYMNFSK